MSIVQQTPVVGRRLPKLNSRALASGKGQFAIDLNMPGMLHARVLRSPHAHARIVAVDASRARALPGVACVVMGADAPTGRLGGSVRHRPLIAIDRVRCVGEPVAAVAAIDEATAEAALRLIEVAWEPLPGVFDLAAATAPNAPLVQPEKASWPHLPALSRWFVAEPGNVSHRIRLCQGDVDAAMARAHRVYRDTFSTQAVSHVCPEPHAALARVEPSGRLSVWCSTGKPFRIQGQLCGLLGLDNNQVRVDALDVGCDFGNKGEVSIEGIVAHMALKTRRAVKGVFTREEEFTGAGLRIASDIEVGLGLDADGRILALDMAFRNDIGAYDGYGSMVTLWAAVCAAGPYEIPHARVVGESVHTNNLRGGSFRGFGNPQVSYARECIFDIAARDIGMHPIDFRRLNGWRDGSVSITGQQIRADRYGLGFQETLERLDERFPRRDAGAKTSGTLRRGVGYASGMHGSGYGCLIDADTSGAMLRLNADGTFLLFTGCHDVGQGTTTSLVQIVAECMSVEPDKVALSDQGTDVVPYDNGASASRQLYISGNAALHAARQLRSRLLAIAADALEIPVERLALREGVVRATDPALSNRSLTLAQLAFHAIHVRGEQPTAVGTHSLQGALLDADGKGDPIGAFLFVSQRAEVEVDVETGEVRVLSLAGAHDVGRAINPLVVEGQIEGGLVQGMGYALMEEVRQIRGHPVGANLESYLAPMAPDVPDLVSIIVETREPSGPLGAKGVGEAGLVPTAAAIANAVEDAIGVRVASLPITAEKILAALKAAPRGA